MIDGSLLMTKVIFKCILKMVSLIYFIVSEVNSLTKFR